MCIRDSHGTRQTNNPVPTGATFKKRFTNILLYSNISEPRMKRMTLMMPRNLPNLLELRRMMKIPEPLMFLTPKKSRLIIWYEGKMKQTSFHWNSFKANSLIYFCTPLCPNRWRQRCYQGAHRTSPSSDPWAGWRGVHRTKLLTKNEENFDQSFGLFRTGLRLVCQTPEHQAACPTDRVLCWERTPLAL